MQGTCSYILRCRISRGCAYVSQLHRNASVDILRVPFSWLGSQMNNMLLSRKMALTFTTAANCTSLQQATGVSLYRHGSMAVLTPGSRPVRTSEPLLSEPLSLTLSLQGVASGDPYAKSVILWARVTPPSSAAGKPAAVYWAVARDARFKHIESSGSTVTNGDIDYTAKARHSCCRSLCCAKLAAVPSRVQIDNPA